jgi:hypothetical protein
MIPLHVTMIQMLISFLLPSYISTTPPILPSPYSDYGLLIPDGCLSPIHYDSYVPEGSTYMTQY